MWRALTAQAAGATTYSVTNCADSGTGSLRAEVSGATSGDIIDFAPSVSSCAPILLTSGPISITANLSITGPGANTLAVSGDHAVAVFSVSSGVSNATISGLTIESGDTGTGGAGANQNVSIPGSNETEPVGVGGNGGNGGGVYNAGSLTLANDTISGNTTGSGGAGGSDTVTIGGNNDIVPIGLGGNGGNGGGVYNAGSLTLTSDTVSGNSTGSGGTGGTETVTASGNDDVLSVGGGNGGNGGGIYNAGSLSLTNDTVSGNSTGSAGTSGGSDITDTGTGDTINLTGAGGNGGGIYNDSRATITESTIASNSASSGGGIAFGGGALTLAGTIVANSSSGGNCSFAGGTVVDGGYNLDSGSTCGLTGASDKSNISPQLGGLQENGGPTDTMALSSTSPAIDAIPPGTNGCGTTITTDQRGVPRPQGSGCDIGAYEYGDIAMQSLKASAGKVPTGSKFTYTASVVNAGAVAATGVTVVDTLPAGEKFKSATASVGSCSDSGPTVTCDIGELAAAGTATVTIKVKVKAVKGTELSDTATVSATTGDTNSGNDSMTAIVKVT